MIAAMRAVAAGADCLHQLAALADEAEAVGEIERAGGDERRCTGPSSGRR